MKIATLWIAEKPSMAVAFAQALGIIDFKDASKGAYISPDGGTCVTWLFGHILRDLNPDEYNPDLKKWSLDPLPFVPPSWKKCPREAVKTHFFRVKDLIKNTGHIVLATDFDREGEVIGRELLDECSFKGKVERVNITATDTNSIKKCIASRFDGEIGLPLYYAGLGRAQADWLFGLNLTRALTLIGQSKGLDGVLTAGRVQSAALNIIVCREAEIASFTSKNYYEVQFTMSSQQGCFKGNWLPPSDLLDEDNKLLDHDAALNKQAELNGLSCSVNRSSAHDSKKAAPLPFSLSAAQIECANKYSFPVEKTLEILQSLYEAHLTSYPRTSCRYLPTALLEELDDILDSIVAMDPSVAHIAEKLDKSLRSDAWDDDNVEAHYGLVPTTHRADLSKLNADQVKVYKLVRDNFISQFMPPAVYRNVNLELICGNDKIVSHSSKLINPGWRSYIMPVDDDCESQEEDNNFHVPELEVGTEVNIQSAEVLSKNTTPPKFFTEATLLAVMNNCAYLVKDPVLKKILKSTCGIGTEATRANIIKSLFDRNYIQKKGKQIRATKLGNAVVSILPHEIKSVERTAYWEQQLEAISTRKLSLDTFIKEVIDMLEQIFANGFAELNLEEVIVRCPTCEKPLIRRKSKNGFFWGCSGYPNCTITFNDKRGKPDFNKTKSKTKGK